MIEKKEKIKLNVLSSCNKCFNPNLHLDKIVSESSMVYLSYPYISGSMTKHHFIISTKGHINSLAGCDEDVFQEIRNYMKSIVAFNIEKNHSTVFIEFSRHVNDCQHMEIECIPIKSKYLNDAKMYFKKALLDQDNEWSTNKKIIDTTEHKGNLTKIINGNFSYTHVDFNANGGYLHLIDDIRRFSSLFLREIFAPLLKKEVFEIKYPEKLSPKELIDIVESYKKDFNYYDWTKYQK